MKANKKQKHTKPFHLHIEHMSRWRACLLLASGLIIAAVLRGDSQVFGAVGEAYMEETAQFNTHVREERNHAQATVHVLRLPTMSGQ